jgi:hypothetical protein
MKNKQTRASRYVQQPVGYCAFIPAPLPPEPPIGLTLLRPALLDRSPRSADDDFIADVKSRVRDAAEALRSATPPTAPVPTKCGACDYRSMCTAGRTAGAAQ